MKRVCLAFVLVFAAGCREAETRTQTVVTIDASPEVQSSVSRVNVTAKSLADDSNRELTSSDSWPIKLVVAPKNGDASRQFELHVSALDADGDELVGLALTSGFSPRTARYASVWIAATCADRERARCSEAACNALRVEAADLGRSGASPWTATVDCTGPPAEMPVAGSHEEEAGRTAPPDEPVTTGGTGGSEPPVIVETAGTAGEPPVVAPPPPGDVDECASGDPCGPRGKCENTSGSYVCRCERGYAGEKGPCSDIDECSDGSSGCAGACINDPGSFHCTCPEGSWLKGDGKGCAQFGSAQKLGGPSSTPTWPHVAIAGNGRGLAVWTQNDGTQTTLWTSRYAPEAGWAKATKLPTGAAPESPKVALDAMGRGLVIWMQPGPSFKDLWGVRFTGSGFGTPSLLENEEGGNVSSPTVALDPGGEGFAIWTYNDAEIWGNRWLLAPAPQFAGAKKVGGGAGLGAGAAEISLDASGRGSLVWTQWNVPDAAADFRSAPWIARYDPATGWSEQRLIDITGTAGLPDVQLDGTGHGNIVWRRVDAEGTSIVTRRINPTGLATPTPLSLSMLDPNSTWVLLASPPRIASSAAGNAAAIWTDTSDSANRIVGRANLTSTNEWSPVVTLSQSNSTVPTRPQIALDGSGFGFGIWNDYGADNTRVVRARRIQPDAGFTTGIELDADITPNIASTVRFALAAQGAGLVVWDKQVPTQYEVWARVLE